MVAAWTRAINEAKAAAADAASSVLIVITVYWCYLLR